jgi:hypothetical protein
MLSHLFSDVKANSSYGRGTSTRSAMRKALIAASAAPVDNRRGKSAMRTQCKNVLLLTMMPMTILHS